MDNYRYFSADSHLAEPGDLWTKRIDKKYSHRAPRVERLEWNGRLDDFLVYEGYPPHPVSIGLGAARTGTNDQRFTEAGIRYEDARPGGWDPVERLKDQDLDNLDGEVITTTLGFRLFWLTDPGLQEACFRALNDFMADFSSHNPQRLVGVPAISLYNVENACEELRRSYNMGLKGAMIPLSPQPGMPSYASRVYDPFWATCEELGAPLIAHEITGGRESRMVIAYWDENQSLHSIIGPHEPQRTIGTLVLSGVFERFPNLKFVSTECGTDWVPWMMERLKRVRGKSSYETPLSLRPIEYLQRNVWFTYINEPDAVHNREIIGVDRLMWSSDYPHSVSTFPRSHDIVERDHGSIPADEYRKMLHDNVLELFGISAPVLTR